jgi:hypothetical protein
LGNVAAGELNFRPIGFFNRTAQRTLFWALAKQLRSMICLSWRPLEN